MRFWPFTKKSKRDEKSEAYLVYSEFGPALRTPRDQRLAATFPHIPARMRAEWIEDFKKVHSAVWKAAEESPPQEDATGDFERHFIALFPWMSSEALSRARSLASYYAWHEGYTKV